MIRPSRLATACLAALLAAAASAQQANPFGGFKHDRTQPIEIASDSLEVREAEQMGIFAGDVVAGQGELRLTADKLTVWYGDAAEQTTEDAPPPPGTGDIRRVKAEGDVFLSSKSETARGAWADYDVTEGAVTMGGGVVLTQGDNAIRGRSLSIDLNTGTGRIEGGRVQSVFRPAQASKP